MLVNFNDMPSNSRVWIYQANPAFTEDSKKLLTERLDQFLSSWESHGSALKASWNLFYDRFLIIAVDESYYAASGCSIDKSVGIVKELESELQIELLGKTTIAILEGDSIATFGLKDLKKAIQEGKIHPQTIIFNNLVPTLGDLSHNWKLPAEKTWISGYFNV